MNHFGCSIGNAVTLYLQLNSNRILSNSAGLRNYKVLYFASLLALCGIYNISRGFMLNLVNSDQPAVTACQKLNWNKLQNPQCKQQPHLVYSDAT